MFIPLPLWFLLFFLVALVCWKRFMGSKKRNLTINEEAGKQKRLEKAKVRKKALGIIAIGLVWSVLSLFGILVHGDFLFGNFSESLVYIPSGRGIGYLLGNVLKILKISFSLLLLIIVGCGPGTLVVGICQLFTGKKPKEW